MLVPVDPQFKTVPVILGTFEYLVPFGTLRIPKKAPKSSPRMIGNGLFLNGLCFVTVFCICRTPMGGKTLIVGFHVVEPAP